MGRYDVNMAVSATRNFIDTEISGSDELQRKPLRHAALKEFNAVAAFLGNQFFRGRRKPSRCGDSGVGVIDFADVEEERDEEQQQPAPRNDAIRYTRTLRSPRSELQKMVPSNASQLMQMDLTLLDECPSREDLRKCAWKGCCPQNRAQVWRLLLGHEPLNYNARKSVLKVKRERYRECVSLLCSNEGDTEQQLASTLTKLRSLQKDIEVTIGSRSAGNANESGSFMDVAQYSDYSSKTLRQIEMDLPRTHPLIPIFHVPQVRDPMRRILYLYGMLNPNKNYVQGMNEILTPVLVVFLSSYFKEGSEKGVENFLTREALDKCLTSEELQNAEADAFWIFSLLVSRIEDNFTAEQSGILKRVRRLEEIVKEVDSLLSAHLKRNGNEFIQFACRWMNCLLMRELPFPLVVKLWDALLAEEDGISDLHVYFCAAMMIRFRAELLSKGFEDCIMFLQHLPTRNWRTNDIDVLLSQAYLWKQTLQFESLANRTN